MAHSPPYHSPGSVQLQCQLLWLQKVGPCCQTVSWFSKPKTFFTWHLNFKCWQLIQFQNRINQIKLHLVAIMSYRLLVQHIQPSLPKAPWVLPIIVHIHVCESRYHLNYISYRAVQIWLCNLLAEKVDTGQVLTFLNVRFLIYTEEIMSSLILWLNENKNAKQVTIKT